jgi:hypothetical protein
MHMLQSLFYLMIALHVSGIIVTHLQEHKTTVNTASGNRYTVLMSAAILKELELIRSTCFGRSFRPSSGAQNCVYNNGICQTAAAIGDLIPDSSR